MVTCNFSGIISRGQNNISINLTSAFYYNIIDSALRPYIVIDDFAFYTANNHSYTRQKTTYFKLTDEIAIYNLSIASYINSVKVIFTSTSKLIKL
ncbi:hypothetical protein D3C85_993230 [compost metagenome]